MARGRAKRRDDRRKQRAANDVGPTNEAMKHSEFERAGIAYRRVPAIDTLRKREVITIREHVALSHYRDAFIACEKSETRSCLDDSPKGNGAGPTPAAVRAALKLGRLEDALGSLAPIARFVAGRDNSLSQWAIAQSGCKAGESAVCLPKSHALAQARIDIKFAASRLIGKMEA